IIFNNFLHLLMGRRCNVMPVIWVLVEGNCSLCNHGRRSFNVYFGLCDEFLHEPFEIHLFAEDFAGLRTIQCNIEGSASKPQPPHAVCQTCWPQPYLSVFEALTGFA